MSTSHPAPVAVIGAGAAGLMAAIHAARRGRPVLLLERTSDGGRKILISGGGRCNVLPEALDPARFVSDAPAHLVRRLLLSWPLDQQRAFFETDLGIPLTLESESGKLFPLSERARDVRDGLFAAARAAGVQIRCDSHVTEAGHEAGLWRLSLSNQEPILARTLIVATGGLSVPATGSDGFGLALARRLGHEVRPPYPALTPLTAEPPVHASLAGISLPATLTARVDGQKIVTRGGFLFTHRGYSGPAVLDISHVAVRSRQNGGPRQAISVQWTADDAEAWDQRLQRRNSQTVLTSLRDAIPARLAGWLLADAGVAPERQLAQLPREERRAIVDRLTRYDLPWTGDEGFKKAEVTGGGVALEEVEPATLQSRRHPGLFFCGEMLDAFGPIGGHNFAWAWATGKTAGEGAARQ
jgi:hypothetical protein